MQKNTEVLGVVVLQLRFCLLLPYPHLSVIMELWMGISGGTSLDLHIPCCLLLGAAKSKKCCCDQMRLLDLSPLFQKVKEALVA